MEKNKEVFTVKVGDDNLELAIVRPSSQDQIEGQKIYSQTWANAVSAKSPVRAAIPKILKDQGLWSDEDERRIEELGKEVLATEKKLNSGAKYYKNIGEAREEAVKTRGKRTELNSLLIKRSVLDNHTAEGQAEIAKLNYLIYACTVYNKDRKRFYKSLEDYYNRANEEVTMQAANKYMEFVNAVDFDYEKKYPENAFLLQYGFVNDKLQLVENGRTVDEEGRLVNDKGQWVNEEGQLININGDLINEDGTFVVDFVPFTDENGEVIQPK